MFDEAHLASAGCEQHYRESKLTRERPKLNKSRVHNENGLVGSMLNDPF